MRWIAMIGIVVLALSVSARQWTSTDGATVEADFVKLEEGLVHLRRSDGKVGTIPYEKLVPGDRQYIDALGPGRNVTVGQGGSSLLDTIGRAPDNMAWLIVIGILNLPLCFVWGRMFFGGWAEFFECVRYSFTPDIVSMFRGEWGEDVMSEWKLQFFWIWCVVVTLSQMFLFLYFIAPLFD